MSGKAYDHPVAKRSLGIAQWHELGLRGDRIPVTIMLEGDSMRPLIRRGRDYVTIVPIDRTVQKGDVVLFCGGPERFVVHRVWKVDGDRVQTLGDNCVNPDPWMPLEDVWGLVVKMERDGRYYRLDSRAARAFGLIWMRLFPARRAYLRCRRLAARAVRKIFPKR